METNDPYEAIAAHLPTARDPSLPTGEGKPDAIQAKAAHDLLRGAVRGVERILGGHDEFAVFGDGPAAAASPVSRLGFAGTAQWLCRRALEVGKDEALNNLRDQAKGGYCEYTEYLVLRGLWYNGVIAVRSGLTLERFWDLPGGPKSRRRYLEERWGYDWDDEGFNRAMVIVHRVTAPWSTINARPYLMDPYARPPASQRVHDLARVITLSGPNGSVPWASWVEVPPEIPATGRWGGWTPIDDSGLDGISQSASTIEEALDALEAMPSKKRARVRMALEHLGAAVRRLSPREKAMNLGIAAEAVLLDGQSDSISLTFRLRGAWLLGATAEERTALLLRFKQLYNLRSSAAHGSFKDPQSEEERRKQDRAIQAHMALTADVISAFIRRGGSVDWDALLLGGSAQEQPGRGPGPVAGSRS